MQEAGRQICKILGLGMEGWIQKKISEIDSIVDWLVL